MQVARGVNISPQERFYEGLPSLEVGKQPLSKDTSSGPGCAKGAKKVGGKADL